MKSPNEVACFWVSVIRTVCATAVTMIIVVLGYNHLKPESLRVEEAKNSRLKVIFDNLQYRTMSEKELYLKNLKIIMSSSEEDTQNVKAEVEKEFDLK